MRTSHATPRPPGFIRKHFAAGDRALLWGYGLSVVAPQLVLGWLGAMLLPWLNDHGPARAVSAASLLLVTASLLLWCRGAVGSWRSANRRARRLAAVTVQVLLVVGAVRTIGTLAGEAAGLGEHWQVATGRQPGPDMTFEVGADGRSLRLRGGLNDGTAEALAQTLDRLPTVDTLVLQSDGGWVRQGWMIARIVADRHLATRVEGACSSACTIAFLAGRERIVEPGGRLGFHAFQSVAAVAFAAGAVDRADARDTYRRAGLPDAFIDRVVATPPGRIWFPSPREMVAAGVVTRSGPGGEPPLPAPSRRASGSAWPPDPATAGASAREGSIATFGRASSSEPGPG